MLELNEKQLLVARQDFKSFLAVGVKDYSKLKLKTSLIFFKKKMNTNFEELGCIGYNPALKELTATVKIKKAIGYAGKLCDKGSYEYVRFYLDYKDGMGWKDMGYAAFNVHDIPSLKDCNGKLEKPIDYVVRLKIEPKLFKCTQPNLPKIKVVLSWNSIPKANDPNLTVGTYVWGDVKEAHIQISPLKLVLSDLPFIEIGSILETAVINPEISLSHIAIENPEEYESLLRAKKNLLDTKVDFQELVDTYKATKVEPHRFGYKLLKEAKDTPSPMVLSNINTLFASKKISLADSIVKLNKLKCNTSYEELFCVGADYNQEALIGTLKVKKSSGYSGNLCKKGSKEYVSFWIQEEGRCKWKHAGTTFVQVNDIKNIPRGGLSYSVILPFDFSKYKRKCKRPQVLKIRAVLSWNTPPQGMNCSHWGNVVESYIQIRPKMVWLKNYPKLITVGGVSTDNISNVSGLTKPGAKIEFNQKNVCNHSPFGGVIVVQGISSPYAGMKYRIKITNLTNGGSYYLNNNIRLVGYNPGTGNVTHPTVAPVGNVYTYQPYYNNISSILARFSPGNNDKLGVTIEHLDGKSNSQVIQMDNTFPKLTLEIDDGGNCSHYAKGATIHGKFNVNENFLELYYITTSVGTYTKVGSGLGQSGTVTGTGKFEIKASLTKNCGGIYLKAIQKTVWNSVRTGTYRDIHKIVCLA